MSDAIKGLNAMLASLLPPDRMQAYQEESRKRDEHERKLVADLRRDCLDAMGLLVDAARNPRISKDDITSAIEKLHHALRWARELDQ